MATALEQRFLRFLSLIPGAESLDDLLRGEQYTGDRRADFLLFNRKVIVEVKSLEFDPSGKVTREIDEHRDREDFPLFYGEVEVQKVLRHLPDGDEVNKRLYLRVTRSVENATRSAEDQIENTARLLGLNESAGLLVLLNEGVQILAPDAVARRVHELLHRKANDGSVRSPIANAWLHFESHILEEGPAQETLPLIEIEGARATQFTWFAELLAYLENAWASYNGAPIFKAQGANLQDLNIRPASSNPEPTGDIPLKRSKVWRRNYRQQPHLRELSDAEVIEYGRVGIKRLTPFFMKGGPKKPIEALEPLMVAWSDFLCEAEFRGLDLRKLGEF